MKFIERDAALARLIRIYHGSEAARQALDRLQGLQFLAVDAPGNWTTLASNAVVLFPAAGFDTDDDLVRTCIRAATTAPYLA